jgi:hypothetical protein
MTAVENPTDSKIGTQAVATDYYGLGGDASLVQNVHIAWGAALAATITIWSSNFPEVALNSTDAKEWCQLNPPTGYTAISPPAAASAATPLVLVIPGGTAGCASIDLGNIGNKRLRCRVVATVADFLRIRPNGKF